MSSLYYYYEDRTVFFDFSVQKSENFDRFRKSTFGKTPHIICLFFKKHTPTKTGYLRDFWQDALGHLQKTTKNKGRM